MGDIAQQVITLTEFLRESYEYDGLEIPVTHTSRGVVLAFTPDQIGAINLLGYLALPPAAASSLAESLKHRGN